MPDTLSHAEHILVSPSMFFLPRVLGTHTHVREISLFLCDGGWVASAGIQVRLGAQVQKHVVDPLPGAGGEEPINGACRHLVPDICNLAAFLCPHNQWLRAHFLVVISMLCATPCLHSHRHRSSLTVVQLPRSRVQHRSAGRCATANPECFYPVKHKRIKVGGTYYAHHHAGGVPALHILEAQMVATPAAGAATHAHTPVISQAASAGVAS